MRAAGSAAAGPAGTKAAPRPKITDQGLSDDDLHEEYAWAFVLHNLVPFADKLLGIAGAMDQRPLSIYDWPLRLPFIVWAASRPSSQMALTVAHVMNVIFWAAPSCKKAPTNKMSEIRSLAESLVQNSENM